MHKATMRTRNIRTSEYKHEVAKAQMGSNLANHMSYIFTIILHDKFDFSMKQLENWYNKVTDYRKKWQDDDDDSVKSEDLVINCGHVEVVKFVKSIPMTQKLFLTDIKGKHGIIGGDYYADMAFIRTICLVVPILKKSYKFTNKMIDEFMEWIRYYIDSYNRNQPKSKQKYCDDEMIRQSIIEDEGWDIVKGEKVFGYE